MRVAIHQPNYAPWCGYFAKLLHADVFILLDDVQLPLGRSYVSRTQVLGREGAHWLSVPVLRQRGQTIAEVRFADGAWPRRHLETLRAGYARTPFFDEIWALIEPVYRDPGELLAPFNQRLIEGLATYLEIDLRGRRMLRASELKVAGRGDERLIELVQAVEGQTYLSGPGGLNYQDPARFASAGLALDVKTYVPIAYGQGGKQFVPGLSILDALFHLGRATRQLLTYEAL